MLLNRGTNTHIVWSHGVSYYSSKFFFVRYKIGIRGNYRCWKMFPEFSMWNIKVSTVNIFWLGIYKKALCSQCCEVWGVTGNWISAQGLEELVEHLSIWYTKHDICHFSPQTTHLGQFCHQKYIDKIICLHLIWIVSTWQICLLGHCPRHPWQISAVPTIMDGNIWTFSDATVHCSVFNSDT